MNKLFRAPTMLCFSPPVMVATIIIELSLAVWVVARYAVGTSRRLIVTLLVCLAAFQLAEFNVCSSAMPDVIWSRIGYVFITFLPPLGLHLVMRLRRNRSPVLLAGSYVVAAFFAGAFAFLPTSLNRGVCAGNYVIFRLSEPLAHIYGCYYFALVLLGLGLALWPSHHANVRRRDALRWTAVGYVAFTLPTLIINFLLPMTHMGIPSIMCGFAVILAVILGTRVAPLLEAGA
jgi:hypothetical protein